MADLVQDLCVKGLVRDEPRLEKKGGDRLDGLRQGLSGTVRDSQR